MILGKLVNLVSGLMEAIASLFGYKLQVTLGEHKIRMKYVIPKKVNDRVWDNEFYVNGAVYLKGYANSIKPFLDNKAKSAKLITSERYLKFMELRVFEQIALLASGRNSLERYIKILIAMILFNTLVTSVIVLAMFGVF